VYGENIETSDILKRIRNTRKDLLILVGSRKVPSDFYSEEVSDFNVAVGNQPHSEIAALAVFLDRLFEGRELLRKFRGAALEVLPAKRGKRVISLRVAPDNAGREDLEATKKKEKYVHGNSTSSLADGEISQMFRIQRTGSRSIERRLK
jgi:hypothetical protein